MTSRSSIIVLSLWLMSAPVLAQNAADGVLPRKDTEASSAKTSAVERVAAFAGIHGISAWPRTDGCEYDRAFSGETVGLILTIDSTTAGTARWDGRCHVPCGTT